MKEPALVVVCVGSFVSCALCACAFYIEAAHLEDWGLGGRETLLDQFLRFSLITLFFAAIVGLASAFVVRPWARGIACVIFLEIFLHHFCTTVFFATMRHRIVDGYASLFLPGVEAGMAFQDRHGCCGWTDSESCDGLKACRTIAEQIIPGKKAIFFPVMGAAILCDAAVFIACIMLVKSSYVPLPSFDVDPALFSRSRKRYGIVE